MENQKKSEPLNKNLALVCGTVVMLCIIILIAFSNKSTPSNSVNNNTSNNVDNNVPTQPQQQQGGNQPTGPVDVSADDDPFLGDKNAPVTIIEFSDFQCPFCRKLYKETLPQIKKEYIDTGKAKFVYRDFPLAFHSAAMPAAQGAECADDQGKFWEMHDKIFEEQEKQGSGTVQFTADDVKKWAGEIGLNTSEFSQCLNSEKYKSEVEKDIADGTAVGVRGTPATFINGRLVSGAQPFPAFKTIIDEELKKLGK